MVFSMQVNSQLNLSVEDLHLYAIMSEEKKGNHTDLEGFSTDTLKSRLGELRRYL